MPSAPPYRALDAADFPRWTFATLDFDYDPTTRSVWMSYKADGAPFYSLQTLTEIAQVRDGLQALFASPLIETYPVAYFIMASNKPGVFNLGGDLATFATSIKAGDDATLRHYAHLCVELVHGLVTAYGLPMVTVAVVGGRALGGGLEAALAMDFLVADETATLGTPEASFNTFPGMGAVSLLTRRLGAARAEKFIISGDLYTGAEMGVAGVVDIVAPAGRSRQAALDWMNEGGAARHARRLALAAARRKVFPLSKAELITITDVWVSCCMTVSDHDVRHMERLAAAQARLLPNLRRH
jgi:DSF synthase